MEAVVLRGEPDPYAGHLPALPFRRPPSGLQRLTIRGRPEPAREGSIRRCRCSRCRCRWTTSSATTARPVDRLRRSSTTVWRCQAAASARRCSTSARIWRINELGKLRDLGRISSVSGGSIAAALLAIAWPNLEFDDLGRATNLARHVREAGDAPRKDAAGRADRRARDGAGHRTRDRPRRGPRPLLLRGPDAPGSAGRWRRPALRVQCHRPDERHGLALLPAVHGLVSDRLDPQPDRPPGAGRRGLGRLPAYRLAVDRGLRSRPPSRPPKAPISTTRSRHSDGSR